MTVAGSAAAAPLDLQVVLRFAGLALDGLGRAREEIDALNVYPVPDGDTGTNLFLTFEAAYEALVESVGGDPARSVATDPVAAMNAFSRGALLGARGSSGVIFSQLLGAACARLARTGPGERSPLAFADALSLAAEAGYSAVGQPVEGTILSVVRAAAEAARGSVEEPSHRLGHVVQAAATAARVALAGTPDQLAVLREAGVVDAGGRGLCVVLDAVETAVTGRVRTGVLPLGSRSIPVPAPVASDDLSAAGPAYEVMYLLDADDTAVPALRASLAPLGDSLVVVGGAGLWNVHVHVDDVGAAIEAGIEAGRPHRVRVTHFADQDAHRHAHRWHRSGSGPGAGLPGPDETGGGGRTATDPDPAGHVAPEAAARAASEGVGCAPARRAGDPPRPDLATRRQGRQRRPGRTVVAVATGSGLADLFVQAGATVLPGGRGRRPSTAQVVEAVVSAGTAEVVVLPNDREAVAVAEAAAREVNERGEVRVAVVRTDAQVQGLAALAVHEPGRPFDQDVVEMTAAARHARAGAVTVAEEHAMTTAGPCRPGDVLGMIEGDYVLVGSDQFDVATGILERLLGGGGELVTVLAGAAGSALATRCAAYLHEQHPTVDVVVYQGGQESHPLLLGVE